MFFFSNWITLNCITIYRCNAVYFNCLIFFLAEVLARTEVGLWCSSALIKTVDWIGARRGGLVKRVSILITRLGMSWCYLGGILHIYNHWRNAKGTHTITIIIIIIISITLDSMRPLPPPLTPFIFSLSIYISFYLFVCWQWQKYYCVGLWWLWGCLKNL